MKQKWAKPRIQKVICHKQSNSKFICKNCSSCNNMSADLHICWYMRHKWLFVRQVKWCRCYFSVTTAAQGSCFVNEGRWSWHWLYGPPQFRLKYYSPYTIIHLLYFKGFDPECGCIWRLWKNCISHDPLPKWQSEIWQLSGVGLTPALLKSCCENKKCVQVCCVCVHLYEDWLCLVCVCV